MGLGAIVFILWIQERASNQATEVAEAQCIADINTSTTEERERQAAANQLIIDRANERADSASQRIAELERLADEFREEAVTQGNSCPMSDDLIERLRAIK